MAEGLAEENQVINQFVQRWRDINFAYEALAVEVKKHCEDGLKTVKYIISHRAKPSKSLKASIQHRQSNRITESKGLYQNENEIIEDMVDLAGVRIALYFPDDSEQVERFIRDNFDEAKAPMVWGIDKS